MKLKNTLIHVLIFTLIFLSCNSFMIEPKNILFLGNSLIYYNNLPALFKEVAITHGIEVNVGIVANSNWYTSNHIRSEESLSLIQSRSWDFIIVQGHKLEVAIPEKQAEEYYPSLRVLYQYITETGAEMILFETYASETGYHDLEKISTYKTMQEEMNDSNGKIAKELKIKTAPVGRGWEIALDRYKDINLWTADHEHPELVGSYLSAYIIFNAIFPGKKVKSIKNVEITQREMDWVVNTTVKLNKILE